jgi:hypothetical protein
VLTPAHLPLLIHSSTFLPPGPQEVDGAFRGAVAYGPRVLVPLAPALDGSLPPVPISVPVPRTGGAIDEAPSPASYRLVRWVDMLEPQPASWLPNVMRPSWRADLNDVGYGELYLPLDDPALPQLDEAWWVVQCLLYGDVVFSWLVDELQPVVIDRGEEQQQVVRVSGPGHAGAWETMLLYPYGGAGITPVETERTFNWTAPRWVYQDFSWPLATEVATVFDSPWPGQPAGWPAAGATWIWGSTDHHAGICYFRSFLAESTLESFGVDHVAIMLSADDAAELYLDGQLLTKHDGGPSKITQVTLPITRVDHSLAIAGFKRPRTTDTTDAYTTEDGDTLEQLAVRFYDQADSWRIIYNANKTVIDSNNVKLGKPIELMALSAGLVLGIPGVTEAGDAGVLLAVYKADSAGVVSDLLWTTDGSWQTVAYPSSGPPGMRPGKVLRVAMAEAITGRNAGPWGIATDALDDTDSAGRPWPYAADIATKTGTDLLTFLRELSATYLDWRQYPATPGLSAFVKGTMGRRHAVQLEPPTDPEDPTTGNLLRLRVRRKLGYQANTLLVRWRGGWLDRPHRPSVTEQGWRTEALLGLGQQQSVKEIDRVVTSELNRLARPQLTFDCELAPRDESEVPGIGWHVGDWFDVDDEHGVAHEVQVVSVTVSVDDNGYVAFAPELGDVRADPATALLRSVKKMANGTLAGQSKVATPVNDVWFDTTCCVAQPPDPC